MLTTATRATGTSSRGRCATTAPTAPTSTATTRRGAFLLADFDQLGFNYRMTDLQGALGLRADGPRGLDPRRAPPARARLYDEALADVDWLRTPVDARRATSTATSPTCCLFAPEEPTLAASERLHELPQPR